MHTGKYPGPYYYIWSSPVGRGEGKAKKRDYDRCEHRSKNELKKVQTSMPKFWKQERTAEIRKPPMWLECVLFVVLMLTGTFSVSVDRAYSKFTGETLSRDCCKPTQSGWSIISFLKCLCYYLIILITSWDLEWLSFNTSALCTWALGILWSCEDSDKRLRQVKVYRLMFTRSPQSPSEGAASCYCRPRS